MTLLSDMSTEIKNRIETGIPGAIVQVRTGSDRHYEISVISASFEGQSQVKQQQQVYALITDLMAGNEAPVHAIDRMDLRTKD